MESREDLDDVFYLQTTQQQIKILLQYIFFRIDLGYRYATEEGVLNIFINTYSNILCSVFKNWI